MVGTGVQSLFRRLVVRLSWLMVEKAHMPEGDDLGEATVKWI